LHLQHSYLSASAERNDSLAKNGIYFAGAVCQGAMCGPSRNSLITGLYPHNIGFYRNGQMKDLQKGIWSLPAALHRSGYATAWVGKCHFSFWSTFRINSSTGCNANIWIVLGKIKHIVNGYIIS